MSANLTDARAWWRTQVRAEFAWTGRYRCRYYRAGQGPWLLFLHGLTERAESFAPLMFRLHTSFTCVAYELPTGRGDGAKLDGYRHPHLAADVLALLDHVGAAHATLFASSFGSTIALRALHAHPQRLPTAILQGAFARRRLLAAERLLCAFARYFPGTMQQLPGHTRAADTLDAPAFAGQPPEVYAFFRANVGATPIATTAYRALLLDRLDLRPLLPQIRQPLLLVGGDDDRIVPKTSELEVLAGLPNARRIEYAPCGHYPVYTHPDRLAQDVRAWKPL
jgi:pimeloyl-ACP methyl ester carboxylesterase